MSAALTISGIAGQTAANAGDRGTGGARDYSIHILAKIPSLCALRDMSKVIRLFDEHGDEDHLVRGLHDFRIDCNVPYAIDVQRIAHQRVRGHVIPLAADAEVDYGVTLEVPAVGGTATARCAQMQARGEALGCAGLGGAEDTRQLMPRAKARMIVVQRPKTPERTETPGFVGEMDAAEATAPLGSVTLTSATEASGQPSHLTLSLTAKF